MASNSPNNSTLTFSPLVTNKKARDHFQTPPNPLNRQNQQKPVLSLPNSYIHQSSPQTIKHSKSFLDDGNDINRPDSSSSIPSDNLHNQEEETPLTQADKLRLWRHDALLQHHYKTAIYIGDKVLSLTNDPNDAFWLSQVYYANGNYQIARNLLSGAKFEESVGCRYLAGLCLVKLEKYDEALDIIGEVNPFKKDHSIKNPDGGIKLEASMCYLRGCVYAKQNNFERAKDCYKEAALVDVKCFEAFDQLISNHLLTPDEEWDLLNSLNFEDADNNNELVKMLYTTRLSKYKNINLYEEARQRLNDEYNLSDNVDILQSQADLLFVQCKFQQCLDLCAKILNKDELNLSALSNYLSCLYETGGKNQLFLIAHKLAENYPNNHMTWLAIGIYYFAIKQTSDARLFFSKASLLSPNFGPAWIGFAHTFATDGEHEQAISAYATASRLFPGIHLPNLFLGMQYLQMNNLTLAHEYLTFAYSICSSDPLLLNELGVLHYHKNQLPKAETFFLRALLAAKNLEYGSKAWSSIHCNLAHVYRRLNIFEKAISHFNQVLKFSKKDTNIYSTLGLIYLKLGKVSKAIDSLHIALSIQSNDPIATDLLEKALSLNLHTLDENFLQSSALTNSYVLNTSPGGKPKSKGLEGYNRNSIIQTPINKPSKALRFIGEDKKRDLDLIVEDLRRGADSSDDGEYVMEIESDSFV